MDLIYTVHTPYDCSFVKAHFLYLGTGLWIQELYMIQDLLQMIYVLHIAGYGCVQVSQLSTELDTAYLRHYSIVTGSCKCVSTSARLNKHTHRSYRHD